jgi:hypothetical protein
MLPGPCAAAFDEVPGPSAIGDTPTKQGGKTHDGEKLQFLHGCLFLATWSSPTNLDGEGKTPAALSNDESCPIHAASPIKLSHGVGTVILRWCMGSLTAEMNRWSSSARDALASTGADWVTVVGERFSEPPITRSSAAVDTAGTLYLPAPVGPSARALPSNTRTAADAATDESRGAAAGAAPPAAEGGGSSEYLPARCS